MFCTCKHEENNVVWHNAFHLFAKSCRQFPLFCCLVHARVSKCFLKRLFKECPSNVWVMQLLTLRIKHFSCIKFQSNYLYHINIWQVPPAFLNTSGLCRAWSLWYKRLHRHILAITEFCNFSFNFACRCNITAVSGYSILTIVISTKCPLFAIEHTDTYLQNI